ncbi:MAG: CDP-alcohol phosphatidyltransferase family protein [Candidatus Eremiobacteraeota bacterium]|nr:CDP-alcohol phosphatidyltransferase family protein [Candidatus Eremiobacteraeota bacterium]MBV8720574.1 CDP-alcohol phosphatidyltransferase family protein [Candidatus Eremiobacteraeota bacterium]
MERRPLATRNKPWAKALAARLAAMGVSPNAVSLASVAFAAVAGVALGASSVATGVARVALLLAGAACVQLRLLCNMIDGMIAVEGGKRSIYGDLYNDAPDRFADVAILVGAGYGTGTQWGLELGWAAAVMAVMTAYVRVLGGALGVTQHFCGPMAKPHRMATVTVAAILATGEPLWHRQGLVFAVALGAIAIGAVFGFARRLQLISQELRAR